MKLSALKPLGCCVMARLASLLPLLIRGQDRSLTSHKTLRTRTGPLRTRVGPGLRSGPKSVQSGPVLGLFAVLGLDLRTLLASCHCQHRLRAVGALPIRRRPHAYGIVDKGISNKEKGK